jgi:hypothetical protein
MNNKKIKRISLIILIFIVLCLCINTNNNPNPIIQRIFRPIRIGGGTLYYAGLIPILIVYYSLKALYKQNNYGILNTRLKRIVIAIVLLYIFSIYSQSGVKLYKSFCNDLNSIYCYRNNANIQTWTSENSSHMVCRLELENCSSETKEFFVKVNLPNYFKKAEKLTLVNDTILALNAHERRQFEITLYEGSMNSNVYSNKFDFSLYNNLQEVTFSQSD